MISLPEERVKETALTAPARRELVRVRLVSSMRDGSRRTGVWRARADSITDVVRGAMIIAPSRRSAQ